METGSAPDIEACRLTLQREIARFSEYAKLRCHVDEGSQRREHPRYQRTWPLLITTITGENPADFSAALHDACSGGIAFMSDHHFFMNELVFVRLFWHDATAPRIPAVVKHIAETPHGILTGTEYALANDAACEQALTAFGHEDESTV